MGGNRDETAGYVSFLSTPLTCTGSNSQDPYLLEQRIEMQKESEVQRSQIIIPTSRKLPIWCFTYIVNLLLLCNFLGSSSLRMRHSFPPIRIQKTAWWAFPQGQSGYFRAIFPFVLFENFIQAALSFHICVNWINWNSFVTEGCKAGAAIYFFFPP